ncbi:MAG: hypothetical protein IKE48_04140, partial [Parasporobacterium sp.]|nr:hypothetical protein [Parasporobacterium sp.]
VHEINPDCRVVSHKTFFMPETRAEFDFSQYDYVVDSSHCEREGDKRISLGKVVYSRDGCTSF